MSIYQKKDKKKFTRQGIRLKNIHVGDEDDFLDAEVREDRRAVQKIAVKSTKSLKSNLNLQTGRVIEVKTNYSCLVEIEEKFINCTLGGRLKQINLDSRNLVSVGDYVKVEMDKAGTHRIEEILPRKNSLSRFSEESFQREIVLASNIDYVLITLSWKEPQFTSGLLDRYLCICEIYQIEPLICINKIDLEENLSEIKEELSYYENLGLKIFYTSSKIEASVELLKEALKGKTTVFSGKSGSGKSTLINMLEPGLNLKVAEISYTHYKGKHTTTYSRMFKWAFGGYLIDTPGIKTLTLNKNSKNLIPSAFPGFSAHTDNCMFPNCSHDHEEGCEVKLLVEQGKIPEFVYDSYLRIYESL